MDIVSQEQVTGIERAKGVERLVYRSGVDGREDWALARRAAAGQSTWVVCIHGHGSHGDQLYVREDIATHRLPRYLERGWGILTPNLRDNAWMGPAAAADMAALLAYVRQAYGAKRFIFSSGSMGGTSNLIYAILHPEDVAAVVALGSVSDLASYHAWCAMGAKPIHREIAAAIEAHYGGTPQKNPAAYGQHCVLKHWQRLTMPVFLMHGELDATMPVEQSRALAAKLAGRDDCVYQEIPGGGHDAPLTLTEVYDWLDAMLQKS